MGYVFTPRQFEESKIPTLSDYPKAMQQLKDGLTELYERRLVYGANIHGSNLHPDGGMGSDVDVLVVLNLPEAEGHLRRLHREIKDSTSVPLEFIPVPVHLAQQGRHQLNSYYVNYMETFCRHGIVGNSPIPIIAPKDSWNNPFKELEELLLAQLTKLSKQNITLPSEYNEEHCDFLEKIMRLPIYAAIDILRIFKCGNYPSRDGRPLSKTECCQLYAQEFPQLVTPDLSTVLDMRSRYRQFLQERDGKTPEQYIRLLEEIDGVYPNARRVIEINLEFLLSRSGVR